MWFIRCNHRNLGVLFRRKLNKNPYKFLFITSKLIFMDKKLIFQFVIGYILIGLNQTFPMKPSEFKIFISVESYDEKTSENYRNCYVVEKRFITKLWKISIQNSHSVSWRLEWRLCWNFTSLSFIVSEK